MLIEREEPHAVPKVKQVYYSIPTLKPKVDLTDGNKKNIKLPKTVYDPALWSDAKWMSSLKEALQDAAEKNNGSLVGLNLWTGETHEGYDIMGVIRGGKLDTFFFA